MILQAKYNRIARYGKRISKIDTKHSFPFETVATYHYNGTFHIFKLQAGEPVQYRQTKNW